MKIMAVAALIIVALNPMQGWCDSGQVGSPDVRIGHASWYAHWDKTDPFEHIRNADGSRFDENALTCAMRKRNFGAYYRVTNLSNGKSVVVRHRDYGPARRYRGRRLNRIVDLSKEAFRRIADLKTGVITVKIERISVAPQDA